MRRRVLRLLAGCLVAGSPVSVRASEFKVFGGMGDGSSGGGEMSGVLDLSSMRVPVNLQIQEVDFESQLPPGSILIKTRQRKLYFILPEGRAVVYPVGVGREGFAWSGQDVITNKAEWPDWRPPAEMVQREARRGTFLPKLMKGGPGNPLGARALYIGDTQYRIHGTTAPSTIGRAVSSGCIRMLNQHVIDLYARAQVGARVVVE
jgi:lipoprotein-anchoring transpeptidase ErfK/SrfK